MAWPEIAAASELGVESHSYILAGMKERSGYILGFDEWDYGAYHEGWELARQFDWARSVARLAFGGLAAMPKGEPMAANPWRQEATSEEYSGFSNAPAGANPGRIVGLFDVGIQEYEYQGETRRTAQIFVAVELATRKQNGEPFVFILGYSKSLFTTAKWRAMVEAVMGREFRDGDKFDILSLLDQPVTVQIAHSTSTGRDGQERTYDSMTGIGSGDGDARAMERSIDLVSWSYVTGDPFPALGWLPKWYGRTLEDIADGRVRQQTGRSHNKVGFSEPTRPIGPASPAPAPGRPLPAARPYAPPDGDDDIPF
jgi:hypothetical protein